jgi:hypothetical protein
MEDLRIKTNSIHPSHKMAILKNMNRLYPYRVGQMQVMTVAEEMLQYPHMKEPEVVSSNL